MQINHDIIEDIFISKHSSNAHTSTHKFLMIEICVIFMVDGMSAGLWCDT